MADSADSGEATTLARVQALLDLGRAAEARARILPLVGSDDTSYHAWCLLALCEIRLESFDTARVAAEHAIAMYPEGDWGYRLLSLALSGLGDRSKAADSARRSVACAPELWLTHLTLAESLGKDSPREGLEAAERAVQLAPHQAAAHVTHGYLLDAVGDMDGAERAYLRALELEPGNAKAMNNLGVVALRRGGPTSAARHFSRALRHDPRLTLTATNVAGVGRLLLMLILLAGSAVVLSGTLLWSNLAFVAGARGWIAPAIAAMVFGYALWLRWFVGRLPTGTLRAGVKAPQMRRTLVLPCVSIAVCAVVVALGPSGRDLNLALAWFLAISVLSLLGTRRAVRKAARPPGR